MAGTCPRRTDQPPGRAPIVILAAMSVSVKALIKQPFGPFWDTDILSDACKSTKSRVLPLHNVMLAWNNEPTGCVIRANANHPRSLSGVSQSHQMRIWAARVQEKQQTPSCPC